jgi:hypothetical protein
MFISSGLFACDNNQTHHFENSRGENLQDTLKNDSMKLKITIGEVILTASLIKSKTTEDFIKLLPLDLTMNDLFGREKYAALPKPISTGGKRSFNYEVGDIGYWSPSNDLAIYYKDGGESIPKPGIIILGKIESGIKVFNVQGSVNVKVGLAQP